MDNWLEPALDDALQWIEYQLRDTEQPGCVIAIVHNGRVVLEQAFGYADTSSASRSPRAIVLASLRTPRASPPPAS